MRLKTQGIIIRVSPVGETDRSVTVLTKDKGIVNAFAKRSRMAKSSMVSATQLFSFSEFTIFKGKKSDIIDEAQPLDVFFKLRTDLDKLSLAQYFCELVFYLEPQLNESGDFLRLLYSAFKSLCKEKYNGKIIKSAFEMRAMTLAGFMPDLVGCRICGKFESSKMLFEPSEGTIVCASCLKNDNANVIELSNGALAALRHTIYAPLNKLFAFTLSSNSLKELNSCTEKYVISKSERNFKTLDFYHKTNITEGEK